MKAHISDKFSAGQCTPSPPRYIPGELAYPRMLFHPEEGLSGNWMPFRSILTDVRRQIQREWRQKRSGKAARHANPSVVKKNVKYVGKLVRRRILRGAGTKSLSEEASQVGDILLSFRCHVKLTKSLRR